MGSMLRKGQKLRPVHPAVAAREWGLAADAVGTVICAYRDAARPSSEIDRVDVRFGPSRTVWAAPAAEFAPLSERPSGSELH